MKALSIRQPHADNILDGKKTIELRSWNTKHRGPFLIHSQGFIIGKADLVRVEEYHDLDYFRNQQMKHLASSDKFPKYKYGFVLKNVQRIHPRSQKGQLGFFNTDYGTVIDGKLFSGY